MAATPPGGRRWRDATAVSGPYATEFRREAVRLVEATGRGYQDVAGELGISGESLRKWIKQDGLDRRERSDGLTTDVREELRRLRQQVRDLEAEREILMRAGTFFVREADPR